MDVTARANRACGVATCPQSRTCRRHLENVKRFTIDIRTRGTSARWPLPTPQCRRNTSVAQATIAHCSCRTRTPRRTHCPAHCCYRSRTATAASTATAIATATPLVLDHRSPAARWHTKQPASASTKEQHEEHERTRSTRSTSRSPPSNSYAALLPAPRHAGLAPPAATATPTLHGGPSLDRAPPLRATASPATGRAARARRPSSCRIKRRRAPQRRRPSHRLSRTHSLVHFGRHVTVNLYQFLKERMRYAR